MAGLIEKNAKTPITIRISGEIVDGETSFENIPALAMVFDSSQAASDSYGTVQQEKTFLVAPLDVTPEIPCKIIHDDACYDVKSIKIMRNMKGRQNDFVWQKCGIFCLERQDFDRIGNNSKK